MVIPTLNEAAALPGLLSDLRDLGTLVDEIIVADAGSSDATTQVAWEAGARMVAAPRGRAQQLNAGARASLGKWLLFLHADSRLGPDAGRAIERSMADIPHVDAAVFRFAIDLPWGYRQMIEGGQRIRERLFGLAYGDQGLLVRRRCFKAVGGFPELSLMEDVAMIRKLRRRFRVTRLESPLLTSGRRYRQGGIVRTWLHHTLLITLYLIGVSPNRLARRQPGPSTVAH